MKKPTHPKLPPLTPPNFLKSTRSQDKQRFSQAEFRRFREMVKTRRDTEEKDQ
jgi:hypothetical protein